jgi:protein TonB
MARKQFEKGDQRRSAAVTILLHLLMIFLFFFVGLTYLDPKPEAGIAINFGFDTDGAGDSEAAPLETYTPPQPVQQQSEQREVSESPMEDVVTQEVEDAPAISKPKPEKKPVPQPEKVEEPVKPVEQPKQVPTPKPSSALQQALQSSQSGKGSGEGSTTGGGDQGSPDGDRMSRGDGGGGSAPGTGSGAGGTGNYRLGNRAALTRPKPEGCPGEGRVVVRVSVDREGRVVEATAGDRIPNGPASNTFDACLLRISREAALKTRWEGDADAPELQIGYIIYLFEKK